MNTTTIVAAMLSGGVLTGAALWLLRTYIDAKLRHSLSVRLEEHKLILAKELSEFAARQSAIEVARRQAVIDVFRTMSKAERILHGYMTDLGNLPADDAAQIGIWATRSAEFRDAFNAFQDALVDNEPLIPVELFEELASIRCAMRAAWTRGARKAPGAWTRHDERAMEICETNIAPLRKKLVTSFRALAGEQGLELN